MISAQIRPVFPACPRGLHVAKIGEERYRPGQIFGQRRIFRAFGCQFEDVQDELTRGQQPAKGVGERKRHALARFVVQLGAVGISGRLNVVEGPEPESASR